jgi:Flp pilus assembly protein TadG
MFLLGTVVVGLGVSYYGQVAEAAREGARYASVHGGQYKQDLSNPTLTSASDVYNNAIEPHLAGFDTSQVTYTVTCADPSEMPTRTDNGQTNTVTVTVNYDWVPPLYVSTVTLTSTSVMTMSY